MVNPLGDQAYPIAGTTWLLVYQKSKTDHDKGQKLVDFLKWAETKGKGTWLRRLNYAPLPSALSERVMKEIDSITF